MPAWKRLLIPLPVLVLAVAAIETVSVRLRLPWRDQGTELFVQAVLLWGVLALAALVPAWPTLGFLARRAPDRGASRGLAVAILLGWMVLPVAAHATLDSFVGFEAELSGLASPGPWLLVGLVLVVGVALLFGLARLVDRARPAWLGLGTGVTAGLLGLFVPLGPGSEPVGAAAPADAPNLLLLIWDTTRPDRLGPYGYARETTPHLARFAEQATVFENATSAATFTFTSHLSMLAGVYPSTHGARLLSTRYDPRRARTIADTLRRGGYRTGAFVGTDVLAGRTGIRHGFEVYDDGVDPPVCDTYAWRLVHDLQAVGARLVPTLRGNGNPHWFQDFQRPAEEVLEHALGWIEADDPRPWFCFVNLYDVHWPYLPGADGMQLVSEYTGPLDGYLFRSDAWTPGYEPTETDKRHVAELYDGELLELDRVVDEFLGALSLDDGRTAVLLTSDHGEAFGEEGQWKHEDVGEPQVRIPLILRSAEPQPTGSRVTAPVTNVDVGPTLLALAGLPPLEGMEGVDLGGELDPERVVFVEDRDHLDPLDVRIALYRGDWKLVRRGLGEKERYQLFDLAADPAGREDVAALHPDVLGSLKLILVERRRDRDAADAEVQAEDTGGAAGLQALGYTGE